MAFVAKKVRIPIPQDVAAKVLFESDRTCCVCRMKKPIQIHHIDDDPGNNDVVNLAVLCFDCHRDTQVQGGFDRKLDAAQVRLYRHDWLERVRASRAGRDLKRHDERTPERKLQLSLARLEVAREQGDWLTVARIYGAAGDEALRDEYVGRALKELPSPFYQVLLADLQGRALDLPEDVKLAAAEEVSEDWTTHGQILFDTGKASEAALIWLGGVSDAVENDHWFLAAYYIKHALSQVVDLLFERALQRAIDQGDLWWQLRCYEELGWQAEVKELLLGNEQVIRTSGNRLLQRKLAEVQGDDASFLRLTMEIERNPIGHSTEASEVEGDDDSGN